MNVGAGRWPFLNCFQTPIPLFRAKPLKAEKFDLDFTAGEVVSAALEGFIVRLPDFFA